MRRLVGAPAFVLLLFTGAAALALWFDLRFGRGPSSMPRLILHAFAAVVMLETATRVVRATSDAPAPTMLAIFGALLPALVYIFLASLWVLKMVRGVMPR